LDVFYFRSPLQHVFNPVTNRTQSFKYIFITLTLAGNHSDKEATQVHKDLLEPFLRWLRDSKKVTDYIWKAELQKNGNIHYHITTNQFVLHTDVRNKWNDLQFNRGYLKEWSDQHGHSNPHGTEVKAVKSDNDFMKYLRKYVSKEDKEGRKIVGKVWDCSRVLKEVKRFSTVIDSQVDDMLDLLCQLGKIEPLFFDKCIIYRGIGANWFKNISHTIRRELCEHFGTIKKAIVEDSIQLVDETVQLVDDSFK